MTQASLDDIPNTDRMFLQSISMSNHRDRCSLQFPILRIELDTLAVQ